MRFLQHVNPMQGTDSDRRFSRGNTLPLIARPFGMAAWSPQTNESGDRWFYHPSHRSFEGIRLTHQPSPWVGDYGHLVFMPQSGKPSLSADERASSFRPEDTVIKPNYFKTELLQYRIAMELTPTVRGAAMRLNFQRKDLSRLLIVPFAGEAMVRIIPEKNRVEGFTRANSGGVPDNFALYFVVSFDCDLIASQSVVFNRAFEQQADLELTVDGAGCYVGLEVPDSGEVNVQIGTSFISLEQAEWNLNSEIGSASFETLRTEGADVWESMLGRIEVEDERAHSIETFYTCLYRCCLFPRIWYEIDADGRQRHFSPFDGQVHDGPMYSDNGFWDTYRTHYPLLGLMSPTVYAEMLQAWVNAYKESGWMPKWVSPGERSIMPGTLIDAVFADACAIGIEGYDIETAYEGLLKHALTRGDNEQSGRPGLADYMKYGYLPSDMYHESVNNSLDFYYGDFCIAQIARALGREEDYRYLIRRADQYGKLYDAEVGYMRGRLTDGEWRTPFESIAWGGDYCEGGPWQSSWAVPHDLLGLALLAGGREAFKQKLDELFAARPEFTAGGYSMEIHEMSEMAAIDFGQFAISNQPSFHLPYIYTAIGYPAETQYWVRRTVEELFSAQPGGFPGDEDNGSMSGWYLFSALGLYPLCPGSAEYVLGSPLFQAATLYLENGNKICIKTVNNAANHRYVQRITLNGNVLDRLYVTHKELLGGAELVFEMGSMPPDVSYEIEQLPFSVSKTTWRRDIE